MLQVTVCCLASDAIQERVHTSNFFRLLLTRTLKPTAIKVYWYTNIYFYFICYPSPPTFQSSSQELIDQRAWLRKPRSQVYSFLAPGIYLGF